MGNSETNLTQVISKPSLVVAVKLLEHMTHQLSLVTEKIQERKFDKDYVVNRLRCLDPDADGMKFRRHMAWNWKKRELDPCQLALDKLTFSNQAYQERATISCLSGEEVDNNKLQYWMLHGCNSLAKEKQLLRQVKASQRQGVNLVCSSRLDEIWELQYKVFCMKNSKAVNECYIKELKQHECEREKIIANAAVKGELWKSLGSKKDIQNKINVITLRENQLAVKKNIELGIAKTELKAIEREITSLQKQLTHLQQMRGEVHLCIFKLNQKYEKVDKLMSRCNKDKAFRDGYENTWDGSIRNPIQEALTIVETLTEIKQASYKTILKWLQLEAI